MGQNQPLGTYRLLCKWSELLGTSPASVTLTDAMHDGCRHAIWLANSSVLSTAVVQLQHCMARSNDK